MTVVIFTLFISTLGVLLADPPNWVDNPSDYEFTATISGGIVLNDGVQIGEDTNDIFVAFDENEDVRGIAIVLFPPFGPYEGTPVFEMQMRSNAEGGPRKLLGSSVGGWLHGF